MKIIMFIPDFTIWAIPPTTKKSIRKIKGPAGTDIGAQTAAEIALSIIAVFVQNIRLCCIGCNT